MGKHRGPQAKESAHDGLRLRAKDQRQKMKALLHLIDVAEGAANAVTQLKGNKAHALNLEFAHEGEILFDLDLGDVPELSDEIAALCQSIQRVANRKLAEAEAAL